MLIKFNRLLLLIMVRPSAAIEDLVPSRLFNDIGEIDRI